MALLADQINEQDHNGEDARPGASHVQCPSPTHIEAPEAQYIEYQESHQRNQRDDLHFVQAINSNPSNPTTTFLGTSSHKLR